MKETNTAENKELNPEQIISLMAVYLDEWKHRDSLLWSQTFKLFYANLIIITLPYIADFLGISLPQIDNKVFSIVGIIIAFVFLYISLGYSKRLNASSKTYAKMIKMLENENYQRIPLEKIKNGKIFKTSIATVLTYTLFLVLETIAIILLFV